MSKFGKNIKKIRSVKNLSQQSFADLFGLKRGTLGAYEEGRSEPKIETIIKVTNYFSITVDELLTKDLTVNQLLQFNDEFTIAPQEIEKESFVSVPCITSSNEKAYLENHADAGFISKMPCVSLPINTEKTFRALTVQNLEMTHLDKGLYPRDVVIGELVPGDVIKKLNNGTLVFAVCEKEIVLRRLHKVDKQYVFTADHNNIPDIILKKDDVRELWRVRYVFFRRLPDFSDSIEDKFAILQSQIEQLKLKTGSN
jgi:transcriptional regulator with XRE-family HTH domain